MLNATGGKAVHAENHSESIQARFPEMGNNAMHIERHLDDGCLGEALASLVRQQIDDAISFQQFPV